MTRSTLFAAIASLYTTRDRPGLTGIFRLESNGGDWTHVLQNIDTLCVRGHPADPCIVLAGTADGVYRSTDGGRRFSRTDFPGRVEVWSFLFDAGEPGRILAGGSPLSLFCSRDAGATWQRLADPALPHVIAMPFPPRVTRLAAHPQRPEDIYASLEVRGVMRSTDAGERWTDCSAPLMHLAEDEPRLRSRVVSDDDAEGMLDVHAVCTIADDPDSVTIAARTGLFCSRDGGRRWRDMHIERFSAFTYAHDLRGSLHDPAVLYACLSVEALSRDGGLYRSRDAGRSWQRFDKVSPGGTLNTVCEHPADPRQTWFGTRYGQVFGTPDAGETWRSMPLPAGTRHLYDLACT